METICIIVVEERTPRDDVTSTVSITVDSRLTPSLDNIIDRNTQLLFDQDNDNVYEYKASLVEKVMMVGILSCIRSSGWDWATSNGYTDDGGVVKNFYFEKKIDLSKMKPATNTLKRSGRKVLHFGATSKKDSSPRLNDTSDNGISTAIPNGQPPAMVGGELSLTHSPKQQRRASSVHDTKTANIFKHLAERRKLSQSSNHPLDISTIIEKEPEVEDHAISSASNTHLSCHHRTLRVLPVPLLDCCLCARLARRHSLETQERERSSRTPSASSISVLGGSSCSAQSTRRPHWPLSA